MIIVNTKDLIGPALDWAIASIEGTQWMWEDLSQPCPGTSYSTDAAIGMPILDEHAVSVICVEGKYSSALRRHEIVWAADIGLQTRTEMHGSQGDYYGLYYALSESEVITGPTRLVAGLRCIVQAKCGSKVAVPDTLAPTDQTTS